MAATSANPRPSPWRHPLAIAAVGITVALAIIVVHQNTAAAIFGTRGAEPGSREFLVSQVANALVMATAVFLGTHLAGQVRALLHVQEEREDGRLFLATLATKLALLARDEPAGTYRDSLRLTLPARVLESGHLGTADRELLAALLALQTAVVRYNDLILTNAIVLVNGEDMRLRDTIGRYRQGVERALTEVQRSLPAS